MSLRKWSVALALVLCLVLAGAAVAQAAEVVIVKSELTDADYAARGYSFKTYWETVEKIMKKVGVAYDVISDADVVGGALDASKWSLLILPANAAMSQNEAKAIIKYVKAGGALLTGYNVSLRNDTKGDNVNFLLADVLGVDKKGAFGHGIKDGKFGYIYFEKMDHPFLSGVPQYFQTPVHYTVLVVPRGNVKVIGTWADDTKAPSLSDGRGGAIFQVGRVVYVGENMWDPRVADLPHYITLLTNMITELMSGRFTPASPDPLKPGWSYEGAVVARVQIEKDKVVFPSADLDGNRNGRLMIKPKYVAAGLEAAAEIWTRLPLEHVRASEYAGVWNPIVPSGVHPATIPQVVVAYVKTEKNNVYAAAAYRPQLAPSETRVPGSRDPMGLIWEKEINTGFTEAARLEVRDVAGWEFTFGLSALWGQYAPPSGQTNWSRNAFDLVAYARHNGYKIGVLEFEPGFTFGRRKFVFPYYTLPYQNLEKADHVRAFDFRLRTPLGDVIGERAVSDIYSRTTSWAGVPIADLPAEHYSASLLGVEKVKLGPLTAKASVRTMDKGWRNYLMPELTGTPEEKYNSYGKYVNRRVVAADVSGDILKDTASVSVSYEKYNALDTGDDLETGTKIEVASKKQFGYFTPKASLATTTVSGTVPYSRKLTLESAYKLSDKVSGNLKLVNDFVRTERTLYGDVTYKMNDKTSFVASAARAQDSEDTVLTLYGKVSHKLSDQLSLVGALENLSGDDTGRTLYGEANATLSPVTSLKVAGMLRNVSAPERVLFAQLGLKVSDATSVTLNAKERFDDQGQRKSNHYVTASHTVGNAEFKLTYGANGLKLDADSSRPWYQLTGGSNETVNLVDIQFKFTF